jgi:hypothetical protein
MPARVAEIAAIGTEGLLHAEAVGSRALLRFRPGADVRARLEAIVAAEAECCAFLTLTLTDDNALTIEGPPAAAPVVRDLVAAFGGAGA